MGLAEAANKFSLKRYDPKRGTLDTNFRSFAYLRIWGAVHDEARRASFTKRRGLEKGLKFHMQSIDVRKVDSDGYASPSFEIPVEDDPSGCIDLLESISYLDDREKVVITAIASGLSGKEIGELLGLTPSRVSQLAKKARTKLLENIA